MNDELNCINNLKARINGAKAQDPSYVNSLVLDFVLDLLQDAEEDAMLRHDHKKYEYRHIANNQYSKLKDSIVELMNEGWEAHGELTRNKDEWNPGITEYSQIMRRRSNGT